MTIVLRLRINFGRLRVRDSQILGALHSYCMSVKSSIVILFLWLRNTGTSTIAGFLKKFGDDFLIQLTNNGTVPYRESVVLLVGG